jgi:hypothetical protein
MGSAMSILLTEAMALSAAVRSTRNPGKRYLTMNNQ